tara:strand:- start:72 stop:227 length:156 start_codon:yes stop_codon:yes gene_type:complete
MERSTPMEASLLKFLNGDSHLGAFYPNDFIPLQALARGYLVRREMAKRVAY